MSDEETKSSNSSTETIPPSSETQDRDFLIEKARTFLKTPAVASQDVESRRKFLMEKGLSGEEIDQLISECPPPIPPRTYPRTAPSKLPIILYATFKLLLLLSGASVVSAAIYFTYIFPKLAASFGARSKLLSHQTALFSKLQSLSNDTRYIQREGLVGPWTASSSEETKETASEGNAQVPKSEEQVTESNPPSETPLPQVPGPRLSQNPHNTTQDALLASLNALKLALPKRKAQYNVALQDLSNMTALITSKMYAPRVHSGIEGEVRKEIRAAKGLLLNRKTFVNTQPST
ncbi:hypothetical protein CPB86DRAFT_868934 [Serendipita vermifera]|nr:hypothetical protein CPB86DRAFT_868934 [Serendipita vermifera]